MLLAIGIGEKPEVTFDTPRGLDLTDIKDGEEKEIVAVIRKEEDGKACLVSVNGIKLNEDEPEAEDDSVEEEVETVQSEPTASVKDRASALGLM